MVLSTTGSAASAEDAPRLEWSAPRECISALELERSVSADLGRPAFATRAESELVVRGHVEKRAGGRYEVEVALARAQGEVIGVRRLASDDRDCRSLDEAIAVMLVIMLNVGREELAKPAPSRWSYRLAAGAAATFGRMPGVGAELAVGGGPRLAGVVGFELELGAELGPAVAVDEGSVSAAALGGRLAVTPVLVGGSPELALRLAGGGGALRATAAGFTEVSEAARGFLEFRAGPRLSLRLGPAFRLEVVADAGLMPVRPRFLVENADGSQEELFRPSLFFGSLGLNFALSPP